MKRLLAIFIMVLSIVQAQAKEAYGVLIGETLTIYYDDLRSSREGKIFDMYKNGITPEWANNEEVKTITNVVFDSSIVDYRPTRLYYLFNGFSSLCEIDGINLLNTSNVTDMGRMFSYCGNLTSLDLSNFDTSNVTAMGRMFDSCSSLTSLDLSNFNTSNVKDMGVMFGGCSGLTTLDLSNFNTSNVISMGEMFGGCSGLTTLDLSNFNTSNVTDMGFMFWGCSGLTTLELSNFNTSNVKYINNMFGGCKGLTTLELSNFNTSNVMDMGAMFKGCSGLTTLDLSNFNTSNVMTMLEMFEGCSSLEKVTIGEKFTQLPDKAFAESDMITTFTALMEQPFSINSNCFTDNVKANATLYVPQGTRDVYASTDGWKEFRHISDGSDVSQDREMYAVINDGICTMYYDNEKSDREGIIREYKNGSLFFKNEDAIQKIIFDYSFANARPTSISFCQTTLKEIVGLEYLNTSNVTDMSRMFYYCENLTSLDLSHFDTSNVTNMGYMFIGCDSLTSLDVSHFDTSKVTSMRRMFNGCQSLTELDLSHFDTSKVTDISEMFGNCPNLANLDVSSFNTSNVKDMSFMFNQCHSLTNLDLSHFNTSNATNMMSMFQECTSLISLNVDNFSTSNVTSMSCMFAHCKGLTNLELSHFDTSDVTDMFGMFAGCSSLTTLDVSHFNTSNVTNMGYMFSGCSGLTTLDLSNFNTSNVTNMWYMFSGCRGLTTLDVSQFNTSKVTTMGGMFGGCRSLMELDLRHFDTGSVTDMHCMFEACLNLTRLDVSSFNTSSAKDMSWMFNQCRSLTNLDLSNFNTSNVTIMEAMFQECESLISLNLSNFDTSNVIRMSNMFFHCYSLTNLDLSHFDTNKVTEMWSMFTCCGSLEEVTIGEKFTQLPDKAFAESDKITSFTALMEQPFAINSNCFTDNVKANATLNVPKGTRDVYESTDGWKEFKHISDGSNLEPIDEADNTDYGNGDINSGTDLNGNVVGNIYYNISDENGEYSSAEGCIIIKKPTSDSDMDNLEGQDIFGEDFKNGFTGIVFMVRAGNGTIKVNAQTVGSMTLKVKIGNSQPFTMELEGKIKVSIPYSVTEPTYVYIYGGETTANASGLRAASSDNALKIYGIEWSGEVTSIESINRGVETNAVIYNMNGQRVETPSKGIYIKNGKKVIIK